jgi:tetratricopeptide (TPR) repeat protein
MFALGLFVGCADPVAKQEQDKPDPLDVLFNPPSVEDRINNNDDPGETKDPVALRQRGNQFFNQGEFDQAIGYYTASIEAKEDAKTYFNRGLAYMSKNDLANALEDYGAAIKLEPTAASPYINRGLLLQRMGKTAQGLNDMSEAFKLDANDPSILLNRGLL